MKQKQLITKKTKTQLCTFLLCMPLVATAADVKINETNFPDENFRKYLLEQDYGKDGVLTEAEIKGITGIDVSNKNINNLKGIEYFTALRNFKCDYNPLASLDISKNTDITWLQCQNTSITTLDISKNTAITELWIQSNKLTSLDLSKNTALRHLVCGNNKIATLDLSKNTELTWLLCHNNNLTTLDLSKNTKLTDLSCHDNQLTALDVSKNPSLTIIECYTNQIKGNAMDAFISSLSKNTTSEEHTLKIYYSASREGNNFTENHVATTKAKGWTAYYTTNGRDWLAYDGDKGGNGDDNEPSASEGIAIDETNFPDENFRAYLLRQDYGRDGILTGAEIKEITYLYIGNQNISNLKGVEYFTSLNNLQCYKNHLTSLDVSGCKSLNSISCYHNMIKGETMDAFINSLPEKTSGESANIYIYNNVKDDEGNVCTPTQVTAIKAKGWRPLYCTEINGDTSYWSEYSGSDDDPSTPDDNPSTPDGISIDETNFPDENFRAYLLRQNYGRDGVLTEAEIKEITKLYPFSQNIGSLKGIEYFTALTELYCEDNKLTSLDVSECKSLTRIKCDLNMIKGEAMDALINSLPEITTGQRGSLHIYNTIEGDEGNVCTTSQVAAIKAKGWTPLYCYKKEGTTTSWTEYQGSDDESVGIISPNTKTDNINAPVYNISGQRVTTMKKGLYIINGKKVLVK